MSEDKSGAHFVITFGAIEYSNYEIVFWLAEVANAVCAPTPQWTSSPAFAYPTLTTEDVYDCLCFTAHFFCVFDNCILLYLFIVILIYSCVLVLV